MRRVRRHGLLPNLVPGGVEPMEPSAISTTVTTKNSSIRLSYQGMLYRVRTLIFSNLLLGKGFNT